MDKMLLVILSDGKIDCDGIGFHPSSKETEITAAGTSVCFDPLPGSALNSFSLQSIRLPHCGCDYQVATCLSEAVALLDEQHFDVILFDLYVFDGTKHHLISQRKDSSASLFSRLDVERGCWWLPAEITHEEDEGTQTLWSKSSYELLREICGRMASRVRENPSRDLIGPGPQAPGHAGNGAGRSAVTRDRCSVA